VLLNSNGFKVITDDELFPIDAYLRYLPMCYDPRFDRHNSHRSRYILLSELAKLLPFYGRSRGSDHPGFVAFNRGGEPWYYDILKDRTKNPHAFILGDTGTGKSALCNFLIMQALAIHNPRVFIIEAGGSFDLLADYCKTLGLSINKVKIDTARPVSLNPFGHGMAALDQVEALDQKAQTRFLEREAERLAKDEDDIKKAAKAATAETPELTAESTDNETDDGEGSRDPLGDMVLAALVMITGGEKKEEARLKRSDRVLIMEAIIDAARFIRARGGDQMIASDIVDAFERSAQALDPVRDADRIKRSRDMANGMRVFTRDPVSRQFFDVPGSPWAAADVTVVDFGLFKEEGYEAQRSVAFAGCVSKMLTIAEASQYDNRPIIALFDENHLFTSVPLLASIQTRIAKMGRKLGLGLWLATQNMKDFANESRKMLSLLETWIVLATTSDELKLLERFKPITTEQRDLILSAKKSPRQYTEGVLLSPRHEGLFRNVPPRPYLTMAWTEPTEKNLRRAVMAERGGTELDAAFYLARQMMEKPPEEGHDD
jgi:conjugative transfer ATPase